MQGFQVRFRGHIKKKGGSIIGTPLVFNYILPANVRPTEDKKYYFFGVGSPAPKKPYLIEISIDSSTGKIEYAFTNISGYPGNTDVSGFKVSLDSINYIK